MKYWSWIGPLLLGLLTAPALAANKCVEDSGRIFYQYAPCPANTHGGDLEQNVNRTFYGQIGRPPVTSVITVLPDNSPSLPSTPDDERPPQVVP